MTGKQLRLRRVSREGLYVVVPLDHGVSNGPIPGIEDVATVIRECAAGGATGFVLHKGLIKAYALADVQPGVLLHVSASTDRSSDPDDKRLVASVDDALRLGCDGVSAHTNLGSRTEERQLEDLGVLTSEALEYGMPTLSMMYPRGPTIANPYDPRIVGHAARLAEELGADIVKTLYTGDPKSFRDVASSITIPLLVAGGPKNASDKEFLETVHGAMKGGAAGVSIGRNIFQHRSPRRMTEAVRRVVEGASVADALKTLKEVKA